MDLLVNIFFTGDRLLREIIHVYISRVSFSDLQTPALSALGISQEIHNCLVVNFNERNLNHENIRK